MFIRLLEENDRICVVNTKCIAEISQSATGGYSEIVYNFSIDNGDYCVLRVQANIDDLYKMIHAEELRISEQTEILSEVFGLIARDM